MPPSPLLSVEGLSKAYGAAPLFRELSFTLHEGDRVGLVGPNGTGKSTLLKILAGLETPDDGRVAARKHLRVGYVPQEPTFAEGATVGEVVRRALADTARPLEPHVLEHRAGRALGRVGFDDPEQPWETLSGGWRRRLAIAREVVREPELLLLDEPTNHLDVESILWLEGFLGSEPEAFVVISHDRRFLENVARRMFDLDPRHPEGLLRVEGSWTDLVAARAEAGRLRAAAESTLANRARRELEWLRRGPKARTTKANARIDAAGELFEELDDVRGRGRDRTVALDLQGTGRKTKRLWEAEGVSVALGGRPVLRDVDLLLGRGARLGVLGPNGAGKTTLLRLITGDLAPDAGEIRTAEALRVVYLPQDREVLDPDTTLRRALAPGGDSVVLGGKEVAVEAWAARFLFRPGQIDSPVRSLSGGERARVLLSRIMLQPADLLVLDEPTNDLDIPTLEVLEDCLLEMDGALVLVTHDRYLMDRVCTGVVALDGDGGVAPYADFEQWRAARKEADRAERAAARESAGEPGPGAAAKAAADAAPAPPRRRKLSYHEQREWDAMEERILEAEAELEEAKAAAEDPAIATDAAELQARCERLAVAEKAVERLMERWAELEDRQG